MENKEYIPAPADTSAIRIPSELADLSEELAKNVHEVWAAGRIAAGWKYGEQRDDITLTTPCLVPYEDLPESEKSYDRATSEETIKFILSRGFRIVKD